MKKEDRQKRIVIELSNNPSILIKDLAENFSVSRETIRRDFDELCKSGRLHRRYGGATFSPIGLGMNIKARSEQFLEERRRIAAAALTMIKPNEVIMLGSGATTAIFAEELASHDQAQIVITNSIQPAVTLSSNPSLRVILAPGEVDSTEGFTSGHETTGFIEKFKADVVFLSADGLNSAGVMEYDSRTVWIARTMLDHARRKILLIDHSKFYQQSLERICTLDELDMVITDQAPDEALAESLAQAGIVVSVADSSYSATSKVSEAANLSH